MRRILAFLILAALPIKSWPASCKRLGAYYTEWSKFSYSSADIPWSKVTHLNHAFITPNTDGTLTLPAGFVEAGMVTAAHAAGSKVLVSVGGGLGSANFSTVASNAARRTTFVNAVYNFINTNNYDGADIDWEFPANATDRSNLNLLVTELRNRFNSSPAPAPTWLITAAIPNNSWSGQYMDFAVLRTQMDYFNVMSYDFHGPWSTHTGHNAPLDPPTGDSDGASGNINALLDYYITTRAIPASQLNIGMAFYGYRSDSIESIHQTCPGVDCSPETDVNGIAYNAAAGLVGAGWTRTWDASASSPYLRSNATTGFISYDDPQSVQLKVNHGVNVRALGGSFMWALNHDDMGGGNQPLLDAMVAGMACASTPTATATVTRTNTPSMTASQTRTRTPSPSQTVTSSISNTVSFTRTPSPTATFSPSSSPSGSRTATLSATLTQSQTRTASPSASSTASVSSTSSQTQSRTQTLFFTPSASLTPTTSAIQTQTRSPTSSPTGTPTQTSTETEIPIGSSPTPTASPSRTLTSSTTLTPTSTASATLTVTATQSRSPSTTPTSSKTATGSSTVSASRTVTPSITRTATTTPPASATESPTMSKTSTGTATSSQTATSTSTFTFTASATASPLTAFSATASGTVSPSPTASPTSSPVMIPASPTPKIKKGRPRPLHVTALPNPQSGPGLNLALNMESDAAGLGVRVYTRAMSLVGTTEWRGSLKQGWNQVRVDWDAPCNGLFFVVVTGKAENEEDSQGPVAKVFYLR